MTVRLRAGLPSLRRERVRTVLEHVFSVAAARFGFRLAHYSIQSNHLHLIAEAHDRRALTRGMQGLLVRLARALNRPWGRTGRVVGDRYHARVLKTPREVRSALCYVIHNARHHGLRVAGIDPYSSGRGFDGWRLGLAAAAQTMPCARAQTWLLRVGWRRHGLLGLRDSPGPRAA